MKLEQWSDAGRGAGQPSGRGDVTDRSPQPRGAPAANGVIGLVSISISNATMEFSVFKTMADRDARKSSRVAVVDCAQGGQAMAEWVSPDAPAWHEADRRLAAANVSAGQVQVAWVKFANKLPSGSLHEHGRNPSESGRRKVAAMLLDFFTTDALARSWFAK